jgi:hypothetical protein
MNASARVNVLLTIVRAFSSEVGTGSRIVSFAHDPDPPKIMLYQRVAIMI